MPLRLLQLDSRALDSTALDSTALDSITAISCLREDYASELVFYVCASWRERACIGIHVMRFSVIYDINMSKRKVRYATLTSSPNDIVRRLSH